MRIPDLISMGLRNLLKRKARTILTVLGVLIGTAAIIVMMSLGVGMREANMKAIEQYGDIDIIEVSSWYQPMDENGEYSQDVIEGVLDDNAIAMIRSFPEVEAATPFMRSNLDTVVTGKYKALWGDVMGVEAESFSSFFDIGEGRGLVAGDTNVAVFGSQKAYQFRNTRSNSQQDFYGNADMSQPPPVDVLNDQFVITSDYSYGERKRPGDTTQTTKPKLYKFTGVGVLAGSEEGMYGRYDSSILVSIDWLSSIMEEDARRQGRNNNGGNNGDMVVFSSSGVVARASGGGSGASEESRRYDQALVKVADRNKVGDVMTKINDLGLGAYGPLETLKYMEQSTNQIQMLLGAIAAVSLLVAAIGIANTMVMSVYERTREIAVMKVLGCKLGNIRSLFLFEAGLIGLMGGIVGLLFSMLASYLLNTYGGSMMNMFGGFGAFAQEDMPPISIIPLWLVGLALAFSTFVGIISGFFPARRAMKLSVLKAIHNE